MSSIDDNLTLSQAPATTDFMSASRRLVVLRTIQRQPSCSSASRPALKAINLQTKQAVIFRPRCGLWSCPGCADHNRRMAVARAFYGSKVFLDEGYQINFMTVTSHEKLDPAASLAVLPKAWNVLNMRMKRAAGRVEYFAVPEQHENGRWHLHAITIAKLTTRWLKDNARKCGLGYMAEVEQARSAHGAAAYAAKYTTKMLQNSNFPKGGRRIRASHGWPTLPALPEQPDWTFTKIDRDIPEQHVIDSYLAQEFSVFLADEITAWEVIGGRL